MQHRPQYHFTPESNWMNDPNGLIYYEGEYHLFYQHHPQSNVWGPMHWGHAISTDLLHWQHLPIALYPDDLGDIFSGSAVIDWKNTSGLGQDGRPPMVAVFTHHNKDLERAGGDKLQFQSIAYSNDNGRTWLKYNGNPVLVNPGIKDFRDPKVIWHVDSEKWVMVLVACDRVMIYTSPNLTDWTFASEFGIEGDTRVWECPDLFPIAVEGTEEIKWVLLVSIQKDGPNTGSATSYFIGDFDGMIFRADRHDQRWADYGKDNYAMVTWSDIPEADGRRLAIGWMSNWQYAEIVPTESWRGAMTIPRELTLLKEADIYYLRSLPVREVVSLEEWTMRIGPQAFHGSTRIDIDKGKGLFKIALTFEDPNDGCAGVRISNGSDEYLDVYYNGADKEYCIDRTNVGKSDFSEAFPGVHSGPANYYRTEVQMTIYLDTTSVELFADSGRCVMTDLFFPSVPLDSIEILAEANPVIVKEGYLAELQSA